MREEFKAFGIKGWGVTDEGLLFSGELIPYNQISKINLISTPSTALTNGIAQTRYNGKALTLGFKYADKMRAHTAIDFANLKIDALNGDVKEYKYYMRAHTGTSLEVYENYIVLNFMQTGSVLTNIVRGGALGGKKIKIVDLTSVQYREPAGMTVGFIQFAFPGSVESKGGISKAINDENTIPVQPTDASLAHEIVDYIERRRDELRQGSTAIPVQALSPADEIKKYKGLLDEGIITQEEFDVKKKQLLGL